ncbi:MAG: DNA repair protein RecO [Firmicutes bacterium]|nr:DNA repair protein RecO [Bacillota bacterium]
MIEKVEGVVVSTIPFKESSKILNVFTKEYGLIGMMAKGANRMKSELRSVSDKLTYGYFHIYYKEGKLSNLISVDVIDPFKIMKQDLEKISYASYLLELTEQLVKQNNSSDIYQLFISGLSKIEDGFDPLVITNILELKYLEYLGVMPVIDRCAVCGRTDSIATLSSYLGGYVCNHCRKQEPLVDEKVIKLVRMYYYVDIAKIEKLELSEKVKKGVNQFLNDYYDRYTGLYLKSRGFLKDLNEL